MSRGFGESFVREATRPLWDRRYGSAKGGCGLVLLLLCLLPIGRCLREDPAEPTAAPLASLSEAGTGGASHCGDGSIAGAFASPPDWPAWSCRSRVAAGERWGACLRREAYSSEAGRGCPGNQRCCPPGDVSASEGDSSEPEHVAAPSHGESAWWCVCYSATLGGPPTTSCRPSANACRRLSRRAGRPGSEIGMIILPCADVGSAAKPQDLLGGSGWEPSDVPGWTTADGCVVN
jgi:hypothetical protein